MHEIDREFIIETEAKQVILEFIMINLIDGVDEFDEVDKYKRIILL